MCSLSAASGLERTSCEHYPVAARNCISLPLPSPPPHLHTRTLHRCGMVADIVSVSCKEHFRCSQLDCKTTLREIVLKKLKGSRAMAVKVRRQVIG